MPELPEASVACVCRVCALGAHALLGFPPTACVAYATHPADHNRQPTCKRDKAV